MKRSAILILSGLVGSACEGSGGLPDPGSAEYVEVASSFYTGVAAVQVGESRIAEAAFARAGELAPGEPAIWANLALVALQQRELDTAAVRLERARELASSHGRIELLAGVLARERGMPEDARAHLVRAVDMDTDNLQALYLLARLAAEEGEGMAEARRWMNRILAVRGENRAALLERARLAASAGGRGELLASLDRLQALSGGSELERHLQAARAAGENEDFRRAGAELSMVHMELQRLPEFVEDERALVLSPSRSDLLLTRFLALPTPPARPAAPDTGLSFERQAFSIGPSSWAWVRAVWLNDQAPTALTALTSEAVWVQSGPEALDPFPFPGGGSAAAGLSAMAPLDYDYDFRVDLALAGAGGFRLLRQDEAGEFVDATSGSIPARVAEGRYAGTWAADLDLEGDLDLVLARVDGPPLLLRNQGDGTFQASDGFGGVSGVRDFVWADLDADGDPDAALLDAGGRLHLFSNERYQDPQFLRMTGVPRVGAIRAIAVADMNRDAVLDLVVLAGDGTLRRLSLQPEWRAEVVGQWPGLPPSDSSPSGARLLVADLDNNGALDLVASAGHAARVWLDSASVLRVQADPELGVTDVADLTDDGRLDLIGLAADGTPLALINRGTRQYHSATLRPRAARTTGDRRINPFGVGGEIEVRSGLLYQKQLIRGPTAHFGMGDRERIDVARIIWPNGSVQAEFDLPATKEPLLTRQRLKGSCPWLFAFDGEEMRFVTDFIWRTALGLRINMQGETAVVHSEDWIRIRGDQLAARDGFYDLRITAELWETYYFDHIALLAVDRPEGTEVFVDERFVLPAPEPALHAMAPPRPVARALDQNGRDVTGLIRARDERYLDTFELGPYQGIAEEHYIEVELGDDVPTDGSLWLVATGWVYPTDSSINIAVDQGEHPPLRGLQLEIPDGRGGWTVVNPDLGFPAGKAKTILIDLQGVFLPGTPPRLRLRTNMEVYWDRIAWSVSAPEATLRTQRLLPTTASLRYRGFSRLRQASRTAPELPDYEIAGTAPRWRDLIGFYTRFGDVRPLNESVDDRYTIMNAGDELALQFPAPPPPPDGWTRDFVLIGDGWIKDGDLNTGFSKTVVPLPYHGLADYDRAPGRLQDEPAYRRHPEDWRIFHTRYVTPQDFHHALVPGRDD